MFESCRAHCAAHAGARSLHGGNPVSPVGPLAGYMKGNGAGKARASRRPCGIGPQDRAASSRRISVAFFWTFGCHFRLQAPQRVEPNLCLAHREFVFEVDLLKFPRVNSHFDLIECAVLRELSVVHDQVASRAQLDPERSVSRGTESRDYWQPFLRTFRAREPQHAPFLPSKDELVSNRRSKGKASVPDTATSYPPADTGLTVVVPEKKRGPSSNDEGRGEPAENHCQSSTHNGP
jgi:hypothetical protein